MLNFNSSCFILQPKLCNGMKLEVNQQIILSI
ncbi:Uncharacterised protein [Paenibacillus macerans]|nr:Uncharacterised protein [Paenibacillus macerans]